VIKERSTIKSDLRMAASRSSQIDSLGYPQVNNGGVVDFAALESKLDRVAPSNDFDQRQSTDLSE